MPEAKPPPVSRYLDGAIRTDALAAGRMAFISGARQVGKTTMARGMLESPGNEFSWDDQRFRMRWVRDPIGAVSERGPGPVLLDEIHKDRRWKRRLKGLWDLRGAELPIVVTGSARLDVFRRSGESLLGRFLPYRLHGFTVGERRDPPAPGEVLQDRQPAYPFEAVLRLGGFPEPLLGGSEAKAVRWSRLRTKRLVQEDLRDLRHVHDLQALRVLADLLPERVGGLLSINSLREEVGVAYATVRDWVLVLEALYHILLLRPWAGRIARSLRAEPKLYLFDYVPVTNPGARLENATALHLLKACQYWTDVALGEFGLHFVRTKEKDEVDFLVVRDRRPWMLVECKSGEVEPAPALRKFASRLGTTHNIQLVDRRGFDREYPEHRVRVMDYERFLAGLV
ncbi:MAG: ATP-binding protein [Deltaproteobacteria bacterium]|nr:ATP-binding protein [Deltaproteobacteria bacterium]